MRFAGNVIWFVFGGAFTARLWLVGAAIFAVSVVGLPLSRAAVEMAKLSACPFGKEVVHIRDLDGKGLTPTTAVTGTVGFLVNLLWLLTFGLALCLSHLALGIVCCLTIVCIPWGIQCFKLAGLSLWPIGRRVVSSDLATVARQQAAVERFARYRHRKGKRAGAPGSFPADNRLAP